MLKNVAIFKEYNNVKRKEVEKKGDMYC